MTPLFIGTPEIIFIMIVVLMLFGSKKIPEFARGLGKGLKEFQKASEEIKREITNAGETIGSSPLNSIDEDIRRLDDEITNSTKISPSSSSTGSKSGKNTDKTDNQ